MQSLTKRQNSLKIMGATWNQSTDGADLTGKLGLDLTINELH